MAQNYCVPGNVVDSSKVAQVFGVDPKSPAWPTFQVRNRSFFISIHQPTFRISTDIVNDPDAQASRLLAARTVCKTIKNGTYRLPRPNEFPNQIFAEVKSTAMTELKSYLEKKRSEEPARFLSSFSGFTFKSPDTFNSAPDELKTRAITNEVLFAPGGLPDYPYMSMIVDDETTTYPQLQVYRSISGTDGRISYATEIVNLDKATDNYKEPMCIDRCGVKRPGCETGFSNGGGVSPIIKCLNRGQYMTAGFLCVKD